MTLSVGTQLAQYRIEALLRAGGMGEVYRATDTSLGRQVAIKVLPEAFAQDIERLARFEREAKTLAALNHPPHCADLRPGEVERGASPRDVTRPRRGSLAADRARPHSAR
jgi:serine/threonine protein kinase